MSSQISGCNLRHTFASLMLRRGAKPRIITEALKDTGVAFTMDVYSHIIEWMQQDAIVPDGVLPEVGDYGIFENNGGLTRLANVRLVAVSNLACAPIAQRTRAPVFGTGGRGFESL